MAGYCLAHLFEEEETIAVEPRPERDQPRFDDTTCWVCGATIVDVHCKIVCRHCGFMRDCSDP
jgi:hypothetical protein